MVGTGDGAGDRGIVGEWVGLVTVYTVGLGVGRGCDGRGVGVVLGTAVGCGEVGSVVGIEVGVGVGQGRVGSGDGS